MDSLRRATEPVAVTPPVYEIPINMWRWCKLEEVCAIVPGVAKLGENDFAPSPEELVSKFAALIRLNRLPDHMTSEAKERLKKKIFRYATPDGKGLGGTEVPLIADGRDPNLAPPYAKFELDIGVPYPTGLFVPEGWVLDTLKLIRRGAVYAADYGKDGIAGFYPKNRPGLSGGFIIRSQET
jgi:hypothetical protein